EERQLLVGMANDFLASGRAGAFVTEIAESGMAAEVWSDPLATAALFEAHGRAAAASHLLDHAALHSDGSLPDRLVLPVPGVPGAPGVSTAGGIRVDGVVLDDDGGDTLLVGTDAGRVVVVAASGLHRAPAPGFDPELRLSVVRGDVTEAATVRVLDV